MSSVKAENTKRYIQYFSGLAPASYNGGIRIDCNTKEKATKLFDLLHILELTWSSGRDLKSKNLHFTYEGKTAYFILPEGIYVGDTGYKRTNMACYKFEEFPLVRDIILQLPSRCEMKACENCAHTAGYCEMMKKLREEYHG